MIMIVQERAAWDFVAQENPNFTLAVVSSSSRILSVNSFYAADSQ